MKQKVQANILLSLFYFFLTSGSGNAKAAVHLVSAVQLPQVVFAVGKIDEALHKLGISPQDVSIKLKIDKTLSAQAYRIEVKKGEEVIVNGGDESGLMYGGLRLAELIRFNKGLSGFSGEDVNPYLKNRALKMNIPLDARSPSYDDTGFSAQSNIASVWDMEFWKEFLDEMACHQYNALTLWNPHPFPAMLKLNQYPGVAQSNVCKTTYVFSHQDHPRTVSQEVLDNLETIKIISMDEKISFWRDVMKYAKNRGIDIYFITWNIHLSGAEKKYGIDTQQDNLKTIEYLRYCTRELFQTYPDLKGIGVTAGEMMKDRNDEFSKEKWLWKSYGEGVADVLKEDPSRKINFIHRLWETGLEPIMADFGNKYPGKFELSYKYAKARIYSTPNLPFARMANLPAQMREYDVQAWWNLRNDDIFCFRWGDPEYTRAFIKNMPYSETVGFHMGSDGYVWGRNFVNQNESLNGELEIKKHWYNFMQWGRLGYNPSLDRTFFEASLKEKYSEANVSFLYDSWASVSKIVPQVNRFHFFTDDFQFSPEGCFCLRKGFHTVIHFQERKTLPRCDEVSIPDYIQAIKNQEECKGISPFQVADNLELYANHGLEWAKQINKNTASISSELNRVLTDIETMAWLGYYYASKIRGATELALYTTFGKEEDKTAAIQDLKIARERWIEYGRLASSQYKPQVLARAQNLDWNELTEGTLKDIEIATNTQFNAEP